MRRFGTVFPFLEAGTQARHVGRLVANHDFVKAVLEFGDFDEFLFSNPSVTNLKLFQETAASWGLPGRRIDRIRSVSYTELPTVLRRDDFQVFHLGGWSRMMAGLHYVRARYAPVRWPITAVTHSLHGREVIDHVVRLSHAGLAPHDAVFCTSRDGREAMRRLLDAGERIAGRRFAGQLVHLPLGISDGLLDARGDRDRGRSRLAIPAEAVVLLVLGRMTPVQKMDVGPLCRVLAMRVVPSSAVPVVLLLAGAATPQELAVVKRQVDRHGLDASVRWAANFPLEDKADVLATADILVSPVDNTQETFGLSVLEAMAAGLPVVVSRFDGYKDLVEDGVDGFLVDTWWSEHDPVDEWFDLMDGDIAQMFQSQSVAVDLEQLGDRLLTLIGDPGRRSMMGRAGRAKVESTYRWSRVIARYQREWARLRAEAERTVAEPAGENPYGLGSARIFSGYAAHQLGPETRVRATAPFLDEAPCTETATLITPRAVLAVHAAATAGATVADLVEASGTSDAAGWFVVAWMLKHGLLRLEKPPAP